MVVLIDAKIASVGGHDKRCGIQKKYIVDATTKVLLNLDSEESRRMASYNSRISESTARKTTADEGKADFDRNMCFTHRTKSQKGEQELESALESAFPSSVCANPNVYILAWIAATQSAGVVIFS